MHTGFSVFFSIMIFVNVVGNTLVILAVVLNKPMRSPINWLLINLATADLVVAIFIGVPFVVTPALNHSAGSSGNLLCKMFTAGNFGWIGALASVFSLVAIAIERHGVVLYPHGHKGKLTKSKISILVLSCWVLSTLWAIPGFSATTYIDEIKACIHSWSKPVYGHVYTVGWSVIAGVIPIGIMGVLYTRMVYHLWFAKDNITEATQKALKRHRKRVTKMVIFVTIIYVLCWVPELLIYFLGFTGAITLVGIHHTIASALIVLNSSVNPIVYSLQSSQFRKHLGELICCKRNKVAPISVSSTGVLQRADGNALQERDLRQEEILDMSTIETHA